MSKSRRLGGNGKREQSASCLPCLFGLFSGLLIDKNFIYITNTTSTLRCDNYRTDNIECVTKFAVCL